METHHAAVPAHRIAAHQELTGPLQVQGSRKVVADPRHAAIAEGRVQLPVLEVPRDERILLLATEQRANLPEDDNPGRRDDEPMDELLRAKVRRYDAALAEGGIEGAIAPEAG